MPYPSEWTEVLNKLDRKDAVIAGGAVRDFLLGRPIKDIDVFMSSQGKEADREFITSVFPSAVAQAEHLDEYRPQFSELSSIWHVSREPEHFFHEPVPFQIMFMNMPPLGRPILDVCDVLGRIDLGLCRAGFDGERVCITKDFTQDVIGQTMTVARRLSPENLARTKRRFKRLSQKYPTYTFVNPYE